uniref:Uncharacterized protein n=1 Tax=Rheinheimera sp. BAL341 TaxID=1708203 RepID=A0A486XKX1_9GAMM
MSHSALSWNAARCNGRHFFISAKFNKKNSSLLIRRRYSFEELA